MRKIQIVIMLLFASLSSYGAHASFFRHIEGLPQNTVLCSMQDSNGFIWFGTKDGLCRYDGYQFNIFNVGSNTIFSICEDESDRIWIGTANGLYCLDQHTELMTKIDAATRDGFTIGGEIHSIAYDEEGNIWISSYWNHGLYCYNPEDCVLTNYSQETTPSISCNGIWGVVVDDSDHIWVGGVDGVINLVCPKSGKISSYPLSFEGRNEIMTIKDYNGSYLLVGTSKSGVWLFDKRLHTSTHFFEDNSSELYVRALLPCDDGSVYIGSESGLYHYNPSTGQTRISRLDYSDKNSLSDNAVYSIVKDREGGLYVGTYFGGVNYLPAFSIDFRLYSATGSEHSISGNAVREMVEDTYGRIWIGTEDNGLNMFDPKTGLFESFNQHNTGLSYHNIHGLCLDGDKLYIGYFLHGIDILDLNTMKVRHFAEIMSSGSPANRSVMSIFKDHQGTIWVGTISGLYRFDTDSSTFSPVPGVDQYCFVTDIKEDSSGRLWVTTNYNGVMFSDKTKTIWRTIRPDCLVSSSISEDSSGRIWISTVEGGAQVWTNESDSLKVYGMDKGLGSNTVHKVVCDNNGDIWASTNIGLYKLDKEKDQFYEAFPSNSIVRRQYNFKSGLNSSDGTLYFGSISGLVSFNPGQIVNTPSFTPHTVITSFEIHNIKQSPSNPESVISESIIYNPNIRLNHNQSSFRFEFAAMSFSAPERTHYRFRLIGQSVEWHESFDRYANFVMVPPGRYRFEVCCSENGMDWGSPATVSVRIKPPFLLSVWGLLLELALVATALYFFLRFLHRRRVEKLQIAESRRKADEESAFQQAKIAFFTNMAHEIKTPLTLIMGPFEQLRKLPLEDEELKEDLDIMGCNIRRLATITSEILDYSKLESRGISDNPKMSDINNILSQSISGFIRAFRERNLTVETSMPDDIMMKNVDPEMLTKIFINLISNASKFAGSRIQMKLEESETQPGSFTFTICNDGETVSDENIENMFKPFFQNKGSIENMGVGLGLSLVKQFTQQMGGTISAGTDQLGQMMFSITIPERPAVQQMESKIDQLQHQDKNHEYQILVVEDNSDIRRFIRHALDKRYSLVECGDGKQALEVLKTNEIDLIVTDLRMPDMDGFELCSTIKQNFEYSHIPIVMLTAYGDSQTIIKALELGVDAFIEKPFSVEHLNARISNMLLKITQLKEAFSQNPETPSGGIVTNSLDGDFIKNISDLILQHNEDDNFGLEDMAKMMRISRSTLYRKIKEITGLHPNEFIRVTRLKFAASLLDTGVYRIQEVCYLSGFNSPSYFAKCFQQQFNISPKGYLKRKSLNQ